MSQQTFEIVAELRDDQGKGASRRLRRQENRVPGIVYGGDEAPTPISVAHKKLIRALEEEAFYSHILTLELGGKKQQVVLKDLQRHPFKKQILHLDLQRVKSTQIITMRVPIHFVNETTCPGVKAGGIISHHNIDLEIRCQAQHLPEYIEIDLAALELDKAIHLSEIKLPTGVELPALSGDKPQDVAVVSVHQPRQAKVEASEGSADASAGAEENKDKS